MRISMSVTVPESDGICRSITVAGSSTFHFPEIMLNIITRLRLQRERLTGNVPGVQGGDVPDPQGEEGTDAEGGGGGGE